jgi:hypothetical protein
MVAEGIPRFAPIVESSGIWGVSARYVGSRRSLVLAAFFSATVVARRG